MTAFYFFAVDTHLSQHGASPTKVKAYPKEATLLSGKALRLKASLNCRLSQGTTLGSDKMELPMTTALSIVIVIKQEKNKNHNGND